MNLKTFLSVLLVYRSNFHVLHWMVKGKNFFTLHGKADEYAGEILKDVDVIAEMHLRFEDSVVNYEEALKINPDDVHAIFNIGLVQAEMGDLFAAKGNFSQVVSMDETYAYAYYALALAEEKEENYGNAITNYEQFIKYSTDQDRNKQVKAKIKSLQSKSKSKQ